MKALVLLLAVALSMPPVTYAATYYLTVSGLGGEPDYEQRFGMWAADIGKILKTSDAADGKVETLVNGTREQVRAALERIAKEAQPQDAVVVMLIGHGSFDGYEYKINLPGPDLSAAELATLLDRIPATRQLVVNMTSSSGGSIEVLRRPNRVVIAATKTGTEKNATVFARYWVEALRDPAADTDKNDVVSALEAFRYADKKTATFYESQKRLATEHAVLEDTGKGDAVRAPSPENGEGHLAALLDRIPATRQLVVNMTSSSGGSVESLRRPNRVVIAATKTGTEKNATVFARYWVEALRDPAADTDKNEVVSALEAFRYADKKTAAFYESQKRLATEHAVLEDTGKGEAVRAPSTENGEGHLAAVFPLLRIGAAASAAKDPAKLELLAKKEQLEQQIDTLKYEKAAMAPEEYKKQLGELLLELARTQEALDK